MTLKIGALDLPLLAALEIDQSYEPLGGEGIFRTVNGSGLKQQTWKKTRITTSGSGWLPAGLESLDTALSVVMSCIVPRLVPAVFATRQATLPAARRSDSGHTPWGIALMANGSAVNTTATLVGDVATLTAVTNAVAYKALYLPQFTVWLMRPTDNGALATADYRWQIVAEEV